MSDKVVDNFLDEVAGQGYENLNGEAFLTPFIKLLQPNSAEVTNEVPGCKAGYFYDTANKEVLGDKLKVIPLEFEMLWLEWEENMGGLKGKYLPGSIRSVGDKFNRKNPDTGRDLVDSWCYYVLIVGREDKGAAILSLPVTAIKHLKAWNTMIHHTKLDSGKQAPFYSSVWNIGPTVKTKNSTGQVWYNIGDDSGTYIARDKFITEEQYFDYVVPNREMCRAVMLTYQQPAPVAIAYSPQAALPSAPTTGEQF